MCDSSKATRSYLSLTVACAFLCLCAERAVAVPLVVPNHSFENGTSNSLSDWKGAPNASVARVDGNTVDGSHQAKVVQSTAQKRYGIQTRNPVVASTQAGQTYTVTVWVKASAMSDGASVWLKLRELHPTTGDVLNSLPRSEVALQRNSWRQVTLSRDVTSANAGRSLDIVIERSKGLGSSSESFFADLVQLDRGPLNTGALARTFSSQSLLRSDKPLPLAEGGQDIQLLAAKNEFESFQVGIRAAPDRGIANLDVTVSDLVGRKGTLPLIHPRDITIYKEHSYVVDPGEGSLRQGGPGSWPDALIPKIDPFFGERRSHFPIDVDPGMNQGVWIDVHVPEGQPAGSYSGSVNVTSSDAQINKSFDIDLEVISTRLEDTSPLRSVFLMNSPGYAPCLSHFNPDDYAGGYPGWCDEGVEEHWRLSALYARAGLENRLTISNARPGAAFHAPQAPTTPYHARFSRWILPLIQGSSLPGTAAPRLETAQLSAITAMDSCVDPEKAQPDDRAEAAQCITRWRTYAEANGFADRFIAYVCDEPDVVESERATRWVECHENSNRVTAPLAWPSVQTLVTAAISERRPSTSGSGLELFGGAAWADANDYFTLTDSPTQSDVDILAPNVNRLANKQPSDDNIGDQRGDYDNLDVAPRGYDFLSAANTETSTESQGGRPNELWTYTACPQHGCDRENDGSPYFDAWPTYAVDAPPVQQRAMGWLAYRYDLTGELYFNTTRAYDDELVDSPWTEQFESVPPEDDDFRAGTEGTLFYPGTPTAYGGSVAIGGETHIPIESIRLKRIRDGHEDYELLRNIGSTAAQPLIDELVGSRDTATHSIDATAAEVERFRCELFSAIPAAPDLSCE